MAGAKEEFFFKVVLIGDVGVGKSSIFQRFRDGVFFENLSGTVGLDHYAKSIDTGSGKKDQIKLSLWDTAGMERAGTLTGGHYSGAHGVLLTFAVDDISSLGALNGWKENALRYTEQPVFFLVGNKIDVDDSEVKESSILAFCERHNIPEENCFAVSAKEDDGLDEMWQNIASDLMKSSTPHLKKNNDPFCIKPRDETDGRGCCHR